MSFLQNRDIEDDLAIWREVSFEISTVLEVVQANVSIVSTTCVRDVNFGFIVILGVLRCHMLGTLCIVREIDSKCIVEDRFGILFTVYFTNYYKVFCFENLSC